MIGNFANGHIDFFDSASGEFLDRLRNLHGQAKDHRRLVDRDHGNAA
jgi:hypothetical protein